MFDRRKKDSKNSIIENYDANFETMLKNVTKLVTTEEPFPEYATPSIEPPVKTLELALQVATVIRDEFIADITVQGSFIHIK